MSILTFVIVLGSALLHATWNAMVKASGDRLMSFAYLNLGHLTVGIMLLPFFIAPIEAHVWPWLLASVVIHQLYYYGLSQGYRYGDLSLIYPIQRGIAPILVAIAAWFISDQTLSFLQIVAIIAVCFGVLTLSFDRQNATLGHHPTRAVSFAVFTGFLIASYTIADGEGARGTASAFTYIAWLFVLDALPAIALFTVKRGADSWRRTWTAGGRHSYYGGLMSAAAYAGVIWAMKTSDFASVSALRESSVMFAALIGLFFLGERLSAIRVFAILTVVAGIIAMRFIG